MILYNGFSVSTIALSYIELVTNLLTCSYLTPVDIKQAHQGAVLISFVRNSFRSQGEFAKENKKSLFQLPPHLLFVRNNLRQTRGWQRAAVTFSLWA